MSFDKYNIYSSQNIINSEKDFQNVFNQWKKKYNIISKESKGYRNELITLENNFNDSFNNWKEKIKKKKIIYTAIIGNYDNLQEPKIHTEGWEYICFTDTPSKFNSQYWKIIDIRYYKELKEIQKNILLARIIKWSPTYMFENIDFSIWVDANMVININLDSFINSLPMNVPIILTKHPNRNCIYQEIIAIKSRIDRGIIQENLSGVNKLLLDLKYKIKYPENNGLCQTGLKIHNHRFEENLFNIGKLMRSIMVNYDIIRDQIIFNYVCFELNICRVDLDPLSSMNDKNKTNNRFYINNHNK